MPKYIEQTKGLVQVNQQNTLENLNHIRNLVREGGVPLFFMAVSHLFESGISSFTEDSYVAGIKAIEEKHRQAKASKKTLFMTLEYEKALLEQAYQLSKIPLFDLLLYIKKDMVIDDPEAIPADEEDAESEDK